MSAYASTGKSIECKFPTFNSKLVFGKDSWSDISVLDVLLAVEEKLPAEGRNNLMHGIKVVLQLPIDEDEYETGLPVWLDGSRWCNDDTLSLTMGELTKRYNRNGYLDQSHIVVIFGFGTKNPLNFLRFKTQEIDEEGNSVFGYTYKIFEVAIPKNQRKKMECSDRRLSKGKLRTTTFEAGDLTVNEMTKQLKADGKFKFYDNDKYRVSCQPILMLDFQDGRIHELGLLPRLGRDGSLLLDVNMHVLRILEPEPKKRRKELLGHRTVMESWCLSHKDAKAQRECHGID